MKRTPESVHSSVRITGQIPNWHSAVNIRLQYLALPARIMVAASTTIRLLESYNRDIRRTAGVGRGGQHPPSGPRGTQFAALCPFITLKLFLPRDRGALLPLAAAILAAG